jgi:hypothetical protein
MDCLPNVGLLLRKTARIWQFMKQAVGRADTLISSILLPGWN